MILKVDLLCVIVVILELTNALPYRRFRRQVNSPRNDGSFNEPESIQSKISGSIVGTAYYGKYDLQ
jgi:hypothetical protein